MGKINVLDKHIAELIAAGEVVERPSSVIKELVENSIDAGANAITVEIKNGGISFMRVADNGSGIMRDDVKKAFLRHATSKVFSQNDLDSITTLGFRGEALASICAVSRLELITCAREENAGTLYKIYGGEEVEFTDAGCPNGTTFIIRDLFYNVPARMKFLKKDISEGNAVSALMDKIALSHPEISFTFIKDSRQMFKTPGDNNLKAAIYSVYGKEFTSSLIPVNYELNNIQVRGYISKPVNARANRNMQNFFINGRYIKSKTAGVALDEACKGSVMVGKYAACILHISIACNMVDVNVHPAKIEVRFINERPLFDAVFHAVKSALLAGDERKQVVLNADVNKPSFSVASPQKAFSAKKSDDIKPKQIKTNTESKVYVPDLAQIYNTSPEIYVGRGFSLNDNDYNISSERQSKKETSGENTEASKPLYKPAIPVKPTPELSIEVNEENQPEIKPLIEQKKHNSRCIGELFNTYILVQRDENEFVIIDKHAAHERIIYEKLKADKSGVYEQLLLSPVIVTLDKNDYNAMLENKKVLSSMCFEIDDFGVGNIAVRSIPQFLENNDIKDTITEIAGYLSLNKQDLNTEHMDWIYHNIACRSAVKAGDTNTMQEITALADKLEEDKTLRYCPHGRPVCVVITKYELEKQFGRV